jgi:hypothetical protein
LSGRCVILRRMDYVVRGEVDRDTDEIRGPILAALVAAGLLPAPAVKWVLAEADIWTEDFSDNMIAAMALEHAGRLVQCSGKDSSLPEYDMALYELSAASDNAVLVSDATVTVERDGIERNAIDDNDPSREGACVWLSFRHRGQRYRFSLNHYGKWWDDEQFAEAVAVLRPEGDDPRRFLPAGIDEESGKPLGYVFATPAMLDEFYRRTGVRW